MRRGASFAALIAAAGSGQRLGAGPKALVKLAEKTLLERAIENLSAAVDEVIVAVSAEMQPQLPELAKVRTVLGGATRQASVYNLLKATSAEYVIVHDAARPFLSADVLAAVVQKVQEVAAVSVVQQVADTLIVAATGEVVDRAKLRAVQTPQAFSRQLLLAAHEHALAAQSEATDDAGLLRALGHEVAQVEGGSWLFKVTTPADLHLASVLVTAWDEGKGAGAH